MGLVKLTRADIVKLEGPVPTISRLLILGRKSFNLPLSCGAAGYPSAAFLTLAGFAQKKPPLTGTFPSLKTSQYGDHRLKRVTYPGSSRIMNSPKTVLTLTSTNALIASIKVLPPTRYSPIMSEKTSSSVILSGASLICDIILMPALS